MKSKINIYGSLKSLSIKDFDLLFSDDRIIINHNMEILNQT